MNLTIKEMLNGDCSAPVPQDIADFIEQQFHLSDFESRKHNYLTLMTIKKTDLLDHLKTAYHLIEFWKNLFLGMITEANSKQHRCSPISNDEPSIKYEQIKCENQVINDSLSNDSTYAHHNNCDHIQLRAIVSNTAEKEQDNIVVLAAPSVEEHAPCSELSSMFFQPVKDIQAEGLELNQFSNEPGRRVLEKLGPKKCSSNGRKDKLGRSKKRKKASPSFDDVMKKDGQSKKNLITEKKNKIFRGSKQK